MKDTEDDIPGNFLEDLMRKLKIDIILLNEEVNLLCIKHAKSKLFWILVIK